MSKELASEPLPEPPADYALKMPRQEEATELVSVGRDVFGREQWLLPAAAAAWEAMRAAAEAEGARLLLVSGFRSVARQREIVAGKLARGIAWEEILRVNAYPGHSEHHTGRAIDLGSPDCAHLSEAFAATREHRWLAARAEEFGFTLSYPPNGDTGIGHEPWHWLWRPGTKGASID